MKEVICVTVESTVIIQGFIKIVNFGFKRDILVIWALVDPECEKPKEKVRLDIVQTNALLHDKLTIEGKTYLPEYRGTAQAERWGDKDYHLFEFVPVKEKATK